MNLSKSLITSALDDIVEGLSLPSTKRLITKLQKKADEATHNLSVIEAEIEEIKSIFAEGGNIYYEQLEAFPLSENSAVFYPLAHNCHTRRVPSAPGFNGLTFESILERDGYYKSHKHPNCWEIITAFEGEFMCNGAPLKPLETIYIKPNEGHDLINTSNIKGRVLVYFIHKDSTQANYLLQKTIK